MIPVQNIYYMLCYAFKALRHEAYRSVEGESFDNAADLYAEILIHTVSKQIKQGLRHAYVPVSELDGIPRGKIEIGESLRNMSIQNKKLVCTHDLFTANTVMNQILKTTLKLLSAANINETRKAAIKKLIRCFADITDIHPSMINWRFQYDRNNHTYQLLMGICYLVVKGLLQNQGDGKIRVMDFTDEQQLSRLYEKFILEYYRQEYPQFGAMPASIPWKVDNDINELLPSMKTDVVLTCSDRVLIIDAKYYEHTTQHYYDRRSIHSGNLYQMYAYVKNKAAQLRSSSSVVSGLILYAKTDDEIQPDQTYQMDGNQIAVKTLNLNCTFQEIAAQLDKIAMQLLVTG